MLGDSFPSPPNSRALLLPHLLPLFKPFLLLRIGAGLRQKPIGCRPPLQLSSLRSSAGGQEPDVATFRLWVFMQQSVQSSVRWSKTSSPSLLEIARRCVSICAACLSSGNADGRSCRWMNTSVRLVRLLRDFSGRSVRSSFAALQALAAQISLPPRTFLLFRAQRLLFWFSGNLWVLDPEQFCCIASACRINFSAARVFLGHRA